MLTIAGQLLRRRVKRDKSVVLHEYRPAGTNNGCWDDLPIDQCCVTLDPDIDDQQECSGCANSASIIRGPLEGNMAPQICGLLFYPKEGQSSEDSLAKRHIPFPSPSVASYPASRCINLT